jgi:drug/metabolite transporter (DMT)-like permease
MTKYLLMACGVGLSAAAQVLMKAAAGATPPGPRWLLWMGASGGAYVAAFALYAAVLRRFPLSVAGPVMTVAVMCTVVVAGALLGEPVAVRRWLGVLLGVGAVLVMLL